MNTCFPWTPAGLALHGFSAPVSAQSANPARDLSAVAVAEAEALQ